MKAAVVTIGDEILIGQIVDTNSAWIGKQFAELGISLVEIRSISDQPEAIVGALDDLKQSCELIVLTGGLGPTKDDLTKTTLANYYGEEMVWDEDSWQRIQALFAKRGRTVNEVNKNQAWIPSGCTLFPNDNGTAKGMLFDRDGTVVVSLPGVPYEMKHLVLDRLIPWLKQRFSFPSIKHKTLLTQGLPESILAERLSDFEEELPAQVKLAYLPSIGRVRLRLTVRTERTEEAEHLLSQQVEKLYGLVKDNCFGFDEDDLELVVADLLQKKGLKLGLAESCTGGALSFRFVQHPGVSSFYMGSVVAYSYQAKQDLLGVSEDLLNTKGAVSEEVVDAMALGALKALQADVSIAVSGIAGPDGGTADKPVGTVCVAWAGPWGVKTHTYQLGQNRLRNIETVQFAVLNQLRKELLAFES